MKTMLFLAVSLLSLTACSSSGEDRTTPAPATVRIDSAGVVVDTTTSEE